MALMSLRSRSHVKASMVLTRADHLFIHNNIRSLLIHDFYYRMLRYSSLVITLISMLFFLLYITEIYLQTAHHTSPLWNYSYPNLFSKQSYLCNLLSQINYPLIMIISIEIKTNVKLKTITNIIDL